jgi:hypothetical protein
MLKNKKAIYILIPLNIIIWCYLGYSIYSGLKEDDLPEISKAKSVNKLNDLKDTVSYKLRLNYNDPFLRESEKNKTYSNLYNVNNGNNTANVTVPKNTSPKVPKVEEVKPVPEIKYLGIIKNNTTGISTALVSINGKSYLAKKGDVIEGFGITNITNQVIELKEGKSTIAINKN